MTTSKFKPGDKVVFEHEGEIIVMVLEVVEMWGIHGPIWKAQGDEEYYYQEKHLRLITPLEELL